MTRALNVTLALVLSSLAADEALGQNQKQLIDRHVQAAAKALVAGHQDVFRAQIEAGTHVALQSLALLHHLAVRVSGAQLHQAQVLICRMGLQKHPGDAYLSGALGAALCRLKRFAPALKPLTLATRLQPRNPFWWGLLAQASIYESRQKQAFAALRQGEKLSPRDVFLLETRAECEFRVLRLQACEKTCIRILGINPASLRGHTLLIKVRRLTDRSKEAVTAANAGLKAVGSAKAGAILLERGIALLNLNRLAAAIADLEKAAHLLKTNPIPHQHLAKAWRQAGNRQKAAGARRTWQRLRKASGHQQ